MLYRKLQIEVKGLASVLGIDILVSEQPCRTLITKGAAVIALPAYGKRHNDDLCTRDYMLGKFLLGPLSSHPSLWCTCTQTSPFMWTMMLWMKALRGGTSFGMFYFIGQPTVWRETGSEREWWVWHERSEKAPPRRTESWRLHLGELQPFSYTARKPFNPVLDLSNNTNSDRKSCWLGDAKILFHSRQFGLS